MIDLHIIVIQSQSIIIFTLHSHMISINTSSDPQAHRAAEMAVDRASELDDRRLEVQMPFRVSLREQKRWIVVGLYT